MNIVYICFTFKYKLELSMMYTICNILTCKAVSLPGLGWPPINNPCFVSVDDTPGTPIPGCAKISSTDSVTTFFAYEHRTR